MSKLLKTLALTLSLTSIGALAPMVANAAWYQNGNEWYYTNNLGNNVTGWQQVDGNWYYMWSDGSMAKNTWLESNSKWYYLGNSGAMVYNTVIDGYTIGNEGYWIVTSRGALTGDDITGTHMLRSELGQNQRDIDMSKSLSYLNIETNDFYDNLRLDSLTSSLAQEKIYLSEAKNQCVGKIVSGKYMISDIKFYSQTFKNSDIGTSTKAEIAKQCSISEYKSNSTYIYDRYLLFSSSANNSSEWEAKRIIIEFEVV